MPETAIQPTEKEELEEGEYDPAELAGLIVAKPQAEAEPVLQP